MSRNERKFWPGNIMSKSSMLIRSVGGMDGGGGGVITGKSHCGQHQDIQICEVVRVGPIKHSIGAVQIVIDCSHLRAKLEATYSHFDFGISDSCVGII